jgi:hypothetical protein
LRRQRPARDVVRAIRVAIARIVLPFDQRLHVRAVRLRKKDDVAAGRKRGPTGAKGLLRVLNLDAALDKQLLQLDAQGVALVG